TQFLTEQAEKAVTEIDLSGGKDFLEPDWGLRSISDWVRLKFQIKVPAEQLANKEAADIKKIIHEEVLTLYRQKEAEFPVKAGRASYMGERGQVVPGGQKYDREGLYHWSRTRLSGAAEVMGEEDFRTLSRARIQEKLLEVSKNYFPKAGQADIDAKLDESF